MVLPDNLKLGAGTPIILGGAGHAPGATAANNLGVVTDVITLASLADDAARQSDQFDFLLQRPPMMGFDAAIEIAATPTAGETVEFWLAYSRHATAGQASPGNTTGVDGVYTGYSANLDPSLVQLSRIGIMKVTADATGTIQVATGIGFFIPKARYASLIVVNRTGAAFHSDNVEMSVAFYPTEHIAVD